MHGAVGFSGLLGVAIASPSLKLKRFFNSTAYVNPQTNRILPRRH